ncbi:MULTISPECIES: DUF1294 domain-containing protein [unclassified Moraxella]|uniref:DUF1294 domain-containing protein n=1 Tax=unclassified Moraxella TaxID=2685852 RepID=UPI002B413763|nr:MULTISPECIES: DUF1294 domain-containing protein [unclassified Moraxella]
MTQPKSQKSRSRWACYFASVYTLIIIGLFFIKILPISVPIIYLLSSLASYILYALDKKAAKYDEQRTPERSLHMWALFGGWIGGAFAQHCLRHKTQKTEFQLIFWLSIIANIAFMGYLFLIEPYL